MTMDDEYEDDAKYAELEREMSEPDPNDSWTGSNQPRDGDDGASDRPTQSEAPARDDGETRAAREADELMWRHQEAARQQRQPIDPEQDPLGAIEEIRQYQQREQTRQEYQKFEDTVAAHENSFKALQPDYEQAAEFLEKSRRAELANLFPDNDAAAHALARQRGFPSPKHLRDAIFMNDAQTIARTALASGRNPAAVYFNIAKDRGYQAKPGRSGRSVRSSERAAANQTERLLNLYTDDPEAFDKEWDKAAKSGRFG